MRKLISIFTILQLLYLASKVESLIGQKVVTARNGEFTFVATLQSYPDGSNFCTGSLVTKKHVITAAHCINGKIPAETRVVFQVVNRLEYIVTELSFIVDSWLTYDNWADSRGAEKEPGSQNIATITLFDKVYHIIPVRLNELNKKQIQGKNAIITGWKDINFKKAVVNILSDEDCTRNINLLTNGFIKSGPRIMCTAAKPYVLLECQDVGTPIVDKQNTLLGVNFINCPDPKDTWNNFSEEFSRQYEVNLHFSVDYYREFIVNTTNYH